MKNRYICVKVVKVPTPFDTRRHRMNVFQTSAISHRAYSVTQAPKLRVVIQNRVIDGISSHVVECDDHPIFIDLVDCCVQMGPLECNHLVSYLELVITDGHVSFLGYMPARSRVALFFGFVGVAGPETRAKLVRNCRKYLKINSFVYFLWFFVMW